MFDYFSLIENDMLIMKNMKNFISFELILFNSFIFTTLTVLIIPKIESNNNFYEQNKVISDEDLFLKVPRTSFRNSSMELRPRCRRFVYNYYKPYQQIGTYVYSQYRPYNIPPICTQCPNCCLRPCFFPTPAPIGTTHIPYYTNPKTHATSRTRFTPKTTKKGGFLLFKNYNT